MSELEILNNKQELAERERERERESKNNLKSVEEELLKLRLIITEKEQEKEKVQKSAEAANYGVGFLLFLTLCAFGGVENKLIGIIPLFITLLLFFFWSLPIGNKIGKLIYEIKQVKKRKRKLEDKLKSLIYLEKVKLGKEK